MIVNMSSVAITIGVVVVVRTSILVSRRVLVAANIVVNERQKGKKSIDTWRIIVSPFFYFLPPLF